MAYEDLKWELLEIKKRLQNVLSENQLLKVKVRKLENEVCRKDKQIITLLDPKKSANIAKIVSERGASMVLNLTERNNELEKLISIKDSQIKKLEAERQICKIYSPKDKCLQATKHAKPYTPPYKPSDKMIGARFRSRSVATTPEQINKEPLQSISEIQFEMDYMRLAKNVEKIRKASEENKDVKQPSVSPSTSNRSTGTLDSDKILQCEVTQLKAYILNMFEEMEDMKKTIFQLSVDQDNTKKILKNKNKNIEILTRQIKVLNKNKPRPQKSMSAINMNQKYSSIDSENKDTYSLESCEEELLKKDENSDAATIRNSLIDYYNQLKNQLYVENEMKPELENTNKAEEDDDNDVETGD